MGSYNEVRCRCPRCKKITTYQSKAGSAMHDDHSITSAPLIDLASMEWASREGRLQCEHCGVKILVEVQRMVSISEYTEPE